MTRPRLPDGWLPVQQLSQILPPSGQFAALRVPGRVNLIGDHTDYNGLPVMPCATGKEARVLFRKLNEPKVRLLNVNSRYKPVSFDISTQIEPARQGDWGNYARAAAQALAVWAQDRGEQVQSGFEACVDSTIPVGAGLSSSSALVVAFGMVTARVNGLDMESAALADLMASAERYVGTQGGGMDQAACLLSEKGHALFIEFGPLRTKPIPVPGDAVIVVANSRVASEKSAAERQKYNLRPIEGRLASAIIAMRKGAAPATLAELVEGEPDPVRMVRQLVPQEPLTLADASDLLGLHPSEMKARLLTTAAGDYVEEPQEGYKPADRAVHALTEADRVRRAADALTRGDLALVGALMNDSHESLRTLCETSCPELDALVGSALESGALGARVTGAGFGGCAVLLARRENAAEVMAGVIDRYYRGWLPENRPLLAPDPANPLDQDIFCTGAAAGASFI